MKKVAIYDTTLRDGTQAEGFQLSVPEKLTLVEILDDFGVPYIEGGWPGSNPRDEAFFKEVRSLKTKHARLAAFGATRRDSSTCDDDPSIQALLRSDVPVVTIFGKSSRYQAQTVLGISPEANLELIADTVQYLKARVDEVVFDAEHFFDGAIEDEAYAMKVVETAFGAGANFVVMCDTNGGTLPTQVADYVAKVASLNLGQLGIHTHNDSEMAVANSLVAVANGVSMVQGTINGHGERCGNANIISLIPALELKMGYQCVPAGNLSKLTRVSRTTDEITNYMPMSQQPFVGRRAFAHKGGVHVNAVMKAPQTYEHVEPEAVGNRRRVLASDLSGNSTVVFKAREFGIDLDPRDPWTSKVLEKIKSLEYDGYQFEGAEASLFLLMQEARGKRVEFFDVEQATVTTEMPSKEDSSVESKSTATVRLSVDGEVSELTLDGNGPVHALSKAFRELVQKHYPAAKEVRLTDYKVRILSSGMGFASTVRVLMRATDGRETWGTVGVSTSVVEASLRAIVDAFEHKLLKVGAAAPNPRARAAS